MAWSNSTGCFTTGGGAGAGSSSSSISSSLILASSISYPCFNIIKIKNYTGTQSVVDTSHSSSRGKRPPSSCLGKERVEAQDELPVALEQPPDLCDDTGRVDPGWNGGSTCRPPHTKKNRNTSLLRLELFHDLQKIVVDMLVALEAILHIAEVRKGCESNSRVSSVSLLHKAHV